MCEWIGSSPLHLLLQRLFRKVDVQFDVEARLMFVSDVNECSRVVNPSFRYTVSITSSNFVTHQLSQEVWVCVVRGRGTESQLA